MFRLGFQGTQTRTCSLGNFKNSFIKRNGIKQQQQQQTQPKPIDSGIALVPTE